MPYLDTPIGPLPFVTLFGLRLVDCTPAKARELISGHLASRGSPIRISTINLDFLRQARRSKRIRRNLALADYHFPDGWPIAYLMSLRCGHKVSCLTGSDLSAWFLAENHPCHDRIAIVGGRKSSLRKLDHRFFAFGGNYPASASTYRDPALCQELALREKDLILVALGCPKQEYWIEDNRILLPPGAVAIGVGASIDFATGTVPRAPKLWQKLRLEFLYRMLTEPRRLSKRYLQSLALLLRILYRQRIHGGIQTAS